MQTNRMTQSQPQPAVAVGPQSPTAPSRCRSGRRVFAHAALLVPLVLGFTILGAASGFAISRDSVLARAQSWVDAPVRYSQAKRHLGYRTDCSGYVSMCWRTGTSWSTRSFHTVSHRIPASALLPGDALLKKGYHIRLFYGWVDEAHTSYVAYESADSIVAGTRIHSIAEDLDFGYVPTRYDRITGSPKPRNVLKNGSFNTWAKSWGSQSLQPVWWDTGASWWQTLATRRKDTFRSSRTSLKFINPSGDPAVYTELSQSAPVLAGVDYRLSAWAKTASDTSGLELTLAYLNAAGEIVSETTTTADSSHINATSFKSMSVLAKTPPDAVRALVKVRLAGDTTTSTAGSVVTGTSVFLDDISLTRPKVTASIRVSSTSARNGTSVTLSGPVSPKRAVGAHAVVWIQRPGSGWKKLATTHVYAKDGSGAWRSSFRFTRSMRRGTYRFKTTVPAIPGYLGTTTKSVSVKLR